jgi:2'-5' RNA ligase
VRLVSLNDALEGVLSSRTKVAEISTSPRTFFVHVRVPEHIIANLRDVQKRVIPDESKHQEIDHITLVYTKKPLEDHPPEKVHDALTALREIGEKTGPITAKLQGWGFFDGAQNEGKPSTALVALVDAPGLEHLHVDMVRKLKDLAVDPSDLHVFTPHITLGYLGHIGRPDKDLPALSGQFTIDTAHVASRDHHEIPLTKQQSVGVKAAMDAMPREEIARGIAEETKEHHLSPDLTETLVRDHLSKEPNYYAEHADKEASIGIAAAKFATSPPTNFTMSTSALRQDRRAAPGKGETSPTAGSATPQTGGMHSGGGLK